MKLKRYLSILVALFMVFAFVIPVYAAQDKTPSEKATILNKLTILKGSGGDFNLSGQLSRAEASTFIVRLLGKESYVLSQSAALSATNFKDVPKTEWYAPYIGYCVQQGIIGGITKDLYKPNDNISEKAFLKLVLGVIGMTYGKDYDWNNVCKAAYNKGLVTDKSYYTKTTDNLNYKREDVVNVLYNSLLAKDIHTGITVLQNLVNNDVVNRSDAVSAGLLKDEPVSAVTQVDSTAVNSITVTFNEKILLPKISDIQIYETQNTSTKLTVSAVTSLSDTQVSITTSSQTPEKAYAIMFTSVGDSEGNVVSNVNGSFTGFGKLEVNSVYFKIKRIEPVSKSVVNVYFTQPINANAAIPMNYEILKGTTSVVKGSFSEMNIQTIGAVDNGVSIFLKNVTMTDGSAYTLKVSGSLIGTYGLGLNDGNGDSMNFTAKGTENVGFYVANVRPLYKVSSQGKMYIEVDYNKEVDVDTAKMQSSYSLKDTGTNITLIPSSCAVSGDAGANCSVILEFFGTTDTSKNYMLTINNVQDKFKQITVATDGKYPLTGTSTEKDALSVASISSVDKGAVAVYFNRAISPDTATVTTDYNITGMGSPQFVYFNPSQPYMVKLFYTSQNITSSSTYTLNILPPFKDYTNAALTSPVSATFSGSGTDHLKPSMVEAVIVGKDAIRVRTNEEISSGGLNTTAANFRLEYKDSSNNVVSKVPSNVNFIDPTTLIFRFDSLDLSKSYTLRFVTNFTDYMGVVSLPSSGYDTVSVVMGS